MDRWIPLTDDRPHADSLTRLLGLSAEKIKLMSRTLGFPLRRPSERGTPGVIQSEFLTWVKEQEGRNLKTVCQKEKP